MVISALGDIASGNNDREVVIGLMGQPLQSAAVAVEGDLLSFNGGVWHPLASGVASLIAAAASPNLSAAANTLAIQAAIDRAKSIGGTVVLPAGRLSINALSLSGGSVPWALIGQGPTATILVRDGNPTGNLLNCAASSVPFTLQDFGVDCRNDVAGAGTHAIGIGNVSGVRVRRVNAVNFKSVGILIYSDTGTHLFSNNIVEDCEVDGRAVAEDGILIANMDRSGIVRSRAIGCPSAPGIGIQLKDVCWFCFITDCYAETCLIGGGFGNDNNLPGVQFSTVKGMHCYNNTHGFTSSYDSFNAITGLTVNQNNNLGHCIRTEDSSHNNTYTGVTAYNVNALRGVVYCKGTPSDNYYHIDAVDNLNGTGKIVEFDSTSTRNTVIVERITNPTLPAGGVPDLVNFNANAAVTPSTGNGFRYVPYATFEAVTIAAGVAICANALADALSLLGEGGVADQLDNITGLDNTEGRSITVRATSAGASPITIADGANIDMVGGASFLLDGQPDVWAARYTGASVNKWCEVSRANNG